ncbi:MAG: pyrroline-5-carboxylate reductase [Aquificaceae bacterium]|nr:pyrroline-5-carboxylate reductase [Aquificaceae bacterium]
MNVGIIGYGNMGESFAKALRDKVQIVVYDIKEERRNKALEEGFGVASDLEFLLSSCDWLLLAVKPKDAPSLLESISSKMEGKLLISIVAGLSLSKIKSLCKSSRAVRVMPNINALVGMATMACVFAEGVEEEEKKKFKELFSHCGSLYELQEDTFDTFTALAGSGPAFVFKFVHALALAGVMEGFSYDTAKSIALDVVVGSCELLKRLGGNPEEWITKVASPGGTTIEGLKVLEEKAFVGTLMECIRKTSEKAKKLV